MWLLDIKVDDVGSFLGAVSAAAVKRAGEPQLPPSRDREFVLCDPKGYKLALLCKRYQASLRPPSAGDSVTARRTHRVKGARSRLRDATEADRIPNPRNAQPGHRDRLLDQAHRQSQHAVLLG